MITRDATCAARWYVQALVDGEVVDTFVWDGGSTTHRWVEYRMMEDDQLSEHYWVAEPWPLTCPPGGPTLGDVIDTVADALGLVVEGDPVLVAARDQNLAVQLPMRRKL